MPLTAFYLQARSAFHFGVPGIGVEAVLDHAPSDTLFSAVCAAVRLFHSDADLRDLLGRFENRDPAFLISGGFPYLKQEDGQNLRFYPAPMLLQRAHNTDTHSKKISKTQWLSETLFRRWLANRDDSQLFNDVAADADIPPDVLLTEDEYERLPVFNNRRLFWQVGTVPRVTVGRLSNASEVYQAGRLTIAPGGGLWCAAQADQDTLAWIESILHLLGDAGLGGERSSGYGQFDLEKEALSLPAVRPGHLFVTLSHYHPQLKAGEQALFEDNEIAYQWIVRRGRMGSPDNQDLPRRKVHMIAAGSVLLAPDDRGIYGGMADVTPYIPQEDGTEVRFPNHNVYRYGYALPVGIG